jgi:type II secretory pathway pseudopilin PulG
MDKKGLSKIVIVVIIVAILAVSSIAVYLAMSGSTDDSTKSDGGGTTDTTNNGGTTDTGTEDTGGTTDTGTEDTSGTTADVGEASSLQFKVSVNPADSESVDYTYMIKNAGTSSLMMRIEMQSAGESYIYIINGAQQKVWIYSDGEWMDFSEMYPTYWETWNSAWQGYHDSLLDWTGYGDWTYTTPNGDSVRIYDISINPSLADSLFQH